MRFQMYMKWQGYGEPSTFNEGAGPVILHPLRVVIDAKYSVLN